MNLAFVASYWLNSGFLEVSVSCSVSCSASSLKLKQRKSHSVSHGFVSKLFILL